MSFLTSILAAFIASTPAPPASDAAGAVTSYPTSYFASSSPTTAYDMVQRLPGFMFDLGSAVRGFGGAAGNVIIDGARPASKDDGLDDTLKRIPASSVLRIDLIRGGARGIDMQGKPILANVVLRADQGRRLKLQGSGTRAYDGRLAGTARIEGSAKVGATAFEGALLLSTGFDDGAGDGSRIRRDASGVTILHADEVSKGLAKLAKLSGAVETPVFGGKLRLHASLSSSPYTLTTNDALPAIPAAEYERYHQGQYTAEVGLRFQRDFGAKLSSETFALQQLGRANVSDEFMADPLVAALTGDDVSDRFALRKTSGESILRTKFRYEAHKALALEAGAEGDYNWLTATTTFVQNGAPVALPASDVHVTEARGEAFSTATWTPSKQVTIEAGLKVEASRLSSSGDVVSSRTFVFPKPRAAVTWSPGAADQIRLRVEREVGQLNFDAFAANSGNLTTGSVYAGNPQLTPEQDWVFEAAYERRFWGGADATVSFKHHVLRDVIDRVPVSNGSTTFDSPGNIGAGREDELALILTLPTDRVGLKRGLLTGQTTFRGSRVIDPTTRLARPISQLHANDWEAHFTQGLPGLKATWGFDASGQFSEKSYRFNEIDTDKVKIQTTLFTEYKPKPDLAFRIELRNANGRGVEHAREVYAGPRDLNGPAFVDVRDLHTGRFVFLRFIKTFG